MEVITIRKFFIILLSFVVITSLSLSVFAAGEQPSGSAYNYTNTSGSSTTGTYWVATTNGLYSLTTWLSNIRGTSFWYFDGDNTQSTSNFFNALSYSLFYIGRSLNQLSIPDNYWSSSNVSNIVADVDSAATTVQSIYTKLGTMDTRLSAIDSDTTAIRSDSTSIKTNTNNIANSNNSIDTSTQHMDTNLAAIYQSSNVVTHPYMAANERISAGNSNYNFWWAVSTSLSYIGSDLDLARKSLDAMVPDLDDLHTMFASPEDLALKADQENNISAATSNFLSGSDSATSVGTQSIGKVKDLGDDVSSFFDTGVQATSLFDSLSDTSSDGPWLWFTSAVRDNLTGTQSRSNTKSSSLPGEQVVDYYSSKMAALNKLLGEVSEDD